LVIGCIPGAVAGVLLESRIERMFHQPDVPVTVNAILLLAAIIALLALALFAAERMARHTRDMKDISLQDAILIGLAQALAIFPGVSRSGSTLTAGLALGLKREAAARFSFLIGAPIIAGAGLKSGWDLYQQSAAGSGLATSDLWLFPIGCITAAISGYICIHFLLRFLQNNSTKVFIFYRWALTALIVVVALFRGA
jgi:undecaprenyl-diphosphatase